MTPQSSTSGRPCPAWSQQHLWYVLPLSSNLHSSGFLNDCSCGHGRRDDGSCTFGRLDRIGSYPQGTSHDHSDTIIGRICSSKGAAGEHQEAAYAGKREGTGRQYGSASPLDGSTTQLARDQGVNGGVARQNALRLPSGLALPCSTFPNAKTWPKHAGPQLLACTSTPDPLCIIACSPYWQKFR